MRKKIIIIFILFFLVIISIKLLVVYKNNFSFVFMSYDGFQIDGDTIVKYNKRGGNVIIPQSVNGVTITNIASYAFYDLDIDSIFIPNTIVNIGDYAFSKNNIKYLEIPSSVTNLGEGAFMNNLIKKIDMSNNVVLGNGCFNNNELDTKNAFFLNSYGELISYGGKVKGNVVLDRDISVIGNKAFFDTGIISITLSDSIVSIGDYAFANNYLVDIYLPNSIKYISNSAFLNNNYLTNIFNESDLDFVFNYDSVSVIEKK